MSDPTPKEPQIISLALARMKRFPDTFQLLKIFSVQACKEPLQLLDGPTFTGRSTTLQHWNNRAAEEQTETFEFHLAEYDGEVIALELTWIENPS